MKKQARLNAQAMARKDPLLMGCIVPDARKIFISADLMAGEPTVTTQFTKDPYYYLATFGMVGKRPYVDEHGVLVIDDIYLMGMSVSPMGKPVILDALYNRKYEGLAFPDAWMKDPDLVKKTIKSERALHKIMMLGLERGMGPKKMIQHAQKDGHDLELKEARKFFQAYWKLFKEVKRFSNKLEADFGIHGHIINPFGYRLIPPAAYKSLAWYIQSCVSGIINVLSVKFFKSCPEAQFVTVIHDEIIFQIPEDKEDLIKQHFLKCVESLNQDLGWEIKVRCGWKSGRSLYEAK